MAWTPFFQVQNNVATSWSFRDALMVLTNNFLYKRCYDNLVYSYIQIHVEVF